MNVNEKLFHLTMERDGCGSIIIAAKWGFPNTDEALVFQQALLTFRSVAQPETLASKVADAVGTLKAVSAGLKAARGQDRAPSDPAGLAPGKDVDDLSTVEPMRRTKARKPVQDVKPEPSKEEPAKSPAELAIETDTAAQQAGKPKGPASAVELAKTFREVMTHLEATVPEVTAYFEEDEEHAKLTRLGDAAGAIEAACETLRDKVAVIARIDKSSLRARIERALEMDDLQRRA